MQWIRTWLYQIKFRAYEKEYHKGFVHVMVQYHLEDVHPDQIEADAFNMEPWGAFDDGLKEGLIVARQYEEMYS